MPAERFAATACPRLGFSSKNPCGRRLNPTASRFMTGKSSTRGMCVSPVANHEVLAVDGLVVGHIGRQPVADLPLVRVVAGRVELAVTRAGHPECVLGASAGRR